VFISDKAIGLVLARTSQVLSDSLSRYGKRIDAVDIGSRRGIPVTARRRS
jgi:hypothetical protein